MTTIDLALVRKRKVDTACQDLERWLESAPVGEKLCYHFGPHITGHPVGRIAYRAYEDGFVILYQKREGPKFAYWAQRIAKGD